MQYVAVCCNVCCSVLQCVVVCCNVCPQVRLKCGKRPIYGRRDVKKGATDSFSHFILCRVCKSDLYMWKETYVCSKNQIYMERDV